MKQILSLILFLSLFGSSDLFAQEERANSLQLNWGVGNIMRQDISFSPMIHQKWSALNFAIIYERSKKLEQEAFAKFSRYTPQVGEPFEFNSYFNTGKYSTYTHSLIMLDVHYALGKKVVDHNDFQLTIGGKLRNRLWPADYIFGNAGSFGYYFSFGLDAWLKMEYKLSEKDHLKAHVALPIFSFNSRSPYMSQNDEYFEDNLEHKDLKSLVNFIKRSKFQSWGQSQGIDLDLSYYHTLSAKWDIGASYWLCMNFNQTPTHFASIENVLFLSTRLKF